MTEIEKLAEVIKKVNCDNNCDHDKNEETNGCCDLLDCCIQNIATTLYKQGYRKQSETVKEFAETVKDILDRKIRDHGATDINILRTQSERLRIAYKYIDDLAEQYGKEE